MGKEDSSGPVELKGDDSEKEEIDNNANTEVRKGTDSIILLQSLCRICPQGEYYYTLYL